MARELRPLGDHGRVHVADPETLLCEEAHDPIENRGPGNPLPLRIAVGEEDADLAQRGRAEQGVGDGVAEDVAIGVSEQAECVRDVDRSEDERASGNEPVEVIAAANPRAPFPVVQGATRSRSNRSTKIRSSG